MKVRIEVNSEVKLITDNAKMIVPRVLVEIETTEEDISPKGYDLSGDVLRRVDLIVSSLSQAYGGCSHGKNP